MPLRIRWGSLRTKIITMAAQLQESHTHLEQRVASRTKELAALNDVAQ
jgi:nitrate/nitrite-specific signal transduction histidine kinase